MGGRGKSITWENKQLDLKQFDLNIKIHNMVNSLEMFQENKSVINKNTNLFKKCACCGEYTVSINSSEYKCDICGWIDDIYQNSHVESLKGKNLICLSEARVLFKMNDRKEIKEE